MSKAVLLSDIGGIKTSNEAFLGQDAGTGAGTGPGSGTGTGAGTGPWLEHIWDEALGFALVFRVFWKFGC